MVKEKLKKRTLDHSLVKKNFESYRETHMS